MILEGLFILAFIFFIAILFYKQALEDFDILQIEGNQLERLPDLLTEHEILRDHPHKSTILGWLNVVKIEDFLNSFTTTVFKDRIFILNTHIRESLKIMYHLSINIL